MEKVIQKAYLCISDMTKHHRAYKYRIYPTKTQEVMLAKMFGCSRFVWNHYLNKNQQHYLANKEKQEQNRMKGYLSYFDNAKNLTDLKKEEDKKFLSEAITQSLQATLKHLDSSYKRFFSKASGFPSYKKKNGKQSFTIPQYVKISGKKIKMPKFGGGIKIVIDREMTGRIITAVVSKTPSGKYFVSLLTEEDIQTLPENKKAVGIDLGITSFAYLSDGKEIKNIKSLRKSEKKLKIAQRHLSRKKKGSKNKEKARLKVACLHEKIFNRRTDFLHKTSKKIVDENQIICLENLSVKNMMKNHKLAKAIGDCSWSTFVNQIEYKAKWYGRTVVSIDRFFPSSKVCSECGYKNDRLTLKDREWTCSGCGVFHIRDWNAAKNILKQGLNSLSLGTSDYRCGEEISPSQEGKHLVETSNSSD